MATATIHGLHRDPDGYGGDNDDGHDDDDVDDYHGDRDGDYDMWMSKLYLKRVWLKLGATLSAPIAFPL